MPRLGQVGGNYVRLLRNMEQVVPDMVARIGEAQHQVDYTMFAADATGGGREIVDALKAAAAPGRGVRVNVQFDQIGTFVWPGMPGTRLVRELQGAGVNVVVNKRFGGEGPGLKARLFRPVDHRKILSVDGSTFYVGGMNIAGKFHQWRDSVVRVDGPANAVLSATMLGRFAEDGMRIGDAQRAMVGRAASGPHQGTAGVEILINTPGSRLHATDELMDAIKGASDRVWVMSPNISNPYVVDELAAAAKRGVDVRLAVTAGGGVVKPMDGFTMSFYRQMLDAGATFYRQDGMEHSKVQLIDDVARVGSMNLTMRAMAWDHEISVASNDGGFVKQVEDLFGRTFEKGRKVTYADADKVPARIANVLRKYAGLRY